MFQKSMSEHGVIKQSINSTLKTILVYVYAWFIEVGTSKLYVPIQLFLSFCFNITYVISPITVIEKLCESLKTNLQWNLPVICVKNMKS